MMMLGLFDRAPTGAATLLLDATPFLAGCSISTNEQGFERLTAQTSLALLEVFRLYDKIATPYVGLVRDGVIVWEGRLEDPILWVGRGGSGFSIQALGAIRALGDAPYTALWSTTRVDDFRPMLASEVNTSTPDRYTMDTNNRLYIAPQKNAVLGNTGAAKFGALCFLSPDDQSRGIVGIQFDWTLVSPAANWRGLCRSRDAAFGGIANVLVVTSAGAGTQTGSFCTTITSAQIIDFSMDFNAADAAFAGETGSAYWEIRNLRMVSSTANVVSTTLTVARTNGAGVTCTVGTTARMYVGQRLYISGGGNGESVIVETIPSGTTFTATIINAPGGGYPIGTTVRGHIIYADEIAKDMVAVIAALNSSQLSSSVALIQSPGLDLTDEVYEDVEMLGTLTHLASLGDNQIPPRRWEVGVYEDRKMFFRPQLSASRAWYVDVTELDLERTLNELRNSIYATYQEAAGRTLRSAVSSDAPSVQRYGITRRAAVAADTSSATQANAIRDTALQDTKDPKPRARISFTAVYDITGACYPLWMVRAGDTITIRNLAPTLSTDVDRLRTFRITHTDYDVMADTLEVEPETPPPILEVMLARREEGITS